jgi:hypothetical protein
MKIYLENPSNGAPIKNWYDGHNYWSLEVGEVMAFPESVGQALRHTYGFLREVSLEEFELQLSKLESIQIPKVKVNESGQLVPKDEEEVAKEKEELEVKKEEVKKAKGKVSKANDAKPSKPSYQDLPRGALIAECNKRGVEIKGFGRGVVSKQRIIELLENDDKQK